MKTATGNVSENASVKHAIEYEEKKEVVTETESSGSAIKMVKQDLKNKCDLCVVNQTQPKFPKSAYIFFSIGQISNSIDFCLLFSESVYTCQFSIVEIRFP